MQFYTAKAINLLRMHAHSRKRKQAQRKAEDDYEDKNIISIVALHKIWVTMISCNKVTGNVMRNTRTSVLDN